MQKKRIKQDCFNENLHKLQFVSSIRFVENFVVQLFFVENSVEKSWICWKVVENSVENYLMVLDMLKTLLKTLVVSFVRGLVFLNVICFERYMGG